MYKRMKIHCVHMRWSFHLSEGFYIRLHEDDVCTISIALFYSVVFPIAWDVFEKYNQRRTFLFTVIFIYFGNQLLLMSFPHLFFHEFHWKGLGCRTTRNLNFRLVSLYDFQPGPWVMTQKLVGYRSWVHDIQTDPPIHWQEWAPTSVLNIIVPVSVVPVDLTRLWKRDITDSVQ